MIHSSSPLCPPPPQEQPLEKLTEERAYEHVRSLMYQPVIRFRHLHAVKVMGQGQQEDERHICHLDDLTTMSSSMLVQVIQNVFQAEGHVVYVHPRM